MLPCSPNSVKTFRETRPLYAEGILQPKPRVAKRTLGYGIAEDPQNLSEVLQMGWAATQDFKVHQRTPFWL